MTVTSIETVKELIDEMTSDGTGVDSAWEYTNSMNNKTMFAVFAGNQFCDIHCSELVKDPIQIWEDGKFISKYED